jgi:signal peptidase I
MDLSLNYVKRVVGVPGDRIRIENKQLYRNGVKIHEPYVVHKTDYVDSYRDYFPGEPNRPISEAAQVMLEKHVVNGELVVPPGQYFAMGDNRDNSEDSRYWGFVPRENVIGKPLIVYWSYDAPTERLMSPSISLDHALDLAQHFFTKTRWSRTFMLIRGYRFAG